MDTDEMKLYTFQVITASPVREKLEITESNQLSAYSKALTQTAEKWGCTRITRISLLSVTTFTNGVPNVIRFYPEVN